MIRAGHQSSHQEPPGCVLRVAGLPFPCCPALLLAHPALCPPLLFALQRSLLCGPACLALPFSALPCHPLPLPCLCCPTFSLVCPAALSLAALPCPALPCSPRPGEMQPWAGIPVRKQAPCSRCLPLSFQSILFGCHHVMVFATFGHSLTSVSR